MTQLDSLLLRISGYCARQGIAETTFGRFAVNDGKLVKKLRSGRNTITLKTLARIEAFLATDEPARRSASSQASDPAHAANALTTANRHADLDIRPGPD